MLQKIKKPNASIVACTVALIIAFAVFVPFRSPAQSTKAKTPSKPHNAASGKSATSSGTPATYEEAVVTMQQAMKEVERAMENMSKSDATRMEAEMLKVGAALQLSAAQMEQQAAQLALQGKLHHQLTTEMERAGKEMALTQKQLSQMDFKQLEINMAQAQKEMMQHAREMESNMARAQAEMQTSKIKMERFSQGIAELQKDGLIKKTDALDLKWENDLLLINGKQQSKEISDKYRKYFGENAEQQKEQRKIII